jgi:hypothetical protein
MKTGRLVFAVLGLLLTPAWAHAAHMSLGGNFSFVQLSQGSENSTVVAFPSDVLVGIVPGFRIGAVGARGMDEGFLDLGVVSIEEEHFTALTLNYQRHLTRGATAPFLTAGWGVYRNDFSGAGSDTQTLVGGGLGVTHRLAHGQGALRAEIHVDSLEQSSENDALVSVGLKLGFDLYLH